MARSPIVLLFAPILSVKCLLADFESNLGESVKFCSVENCSDAEGFALIHRRYHSQVTVARRLDGVWEPEGKYTNRTEHHSMLCVDLSRLNFNDNGHYEFSCGGDLVSIIQLEVVRPAPVSVSEEGTVELPCFYRTAGEGVKSVRWERNGSLVIEVDASEQNINRGAKFVGRVSVSSDWFTEGKLSLTLSRAQLQDQGLYVCSVQDKDGKRRRGDPAAARLSVKERKADPTSCSPQPVDPKDKEERKMETWLIVLITAVVTLVIAGPSAFGLGWWQKSRTSNVSSGPEGGTSAREKSPLCNGASAADPDIPVETANGYRG